MVGGVAGRGYDAKLEFACLYLVRVGDHSIVWSDVAPAAVPAIEFVEVVDLVRRETMGPGEVLDIPAPIGLGPIQPLHPGDRGLVHDQLGAR
jgi:hypothetical protein